MTGGEVCVRDVIVCSRTTPICEAAQLMLRFNVGDVVVTEEPGKRIPLGIVTDRDIVVGVVALKMNPTLTTAGDVMKKAVITVHEDHGVFETVQHMRMRGFRRIPVVNGEGARGDPVDRRCDSTARGRDDRTGEIGVQRTTSLVGTHGANRHDPSRNFRNN